MNTEFAGARYFLMIPVGIARNKTLLKKPKTIELMGEIITMLNITGEFYMSNNRIAEILDISRSTAIDYLNYLERYEFIKRIMVKDETGAIIKRNITLGPATTKALKAGWSDGSNGGSSHYQTRGSSPDTTRVVGQTGPKYINEREHDNRSNNIYCQAKDLTRNPNPPYKEIIDYLNEKAGRNYAVEAAKNRKFIRARWNEGYNLDAFKKVIDIKVAQWKDDPEWDEYLRPETLFSGKFDRYLNEKKKEKRPDLFKENSNSILDIPDEELPF